MRKAIAAVLALTGCATTADPNYLIQMQAYQEVERGRKEVALARAQADAARYEAIARIGSSADRESRAMAVMALALGGDRSVAIETRTEVPRIPETDADRAYKWAALFAGPLTNVAMGYFSYRLGVTQSNNQANQAIANSATMAGIANNGFQATENIAATGFDAIKAVYSAPTPAGPVTTINLSGAGAISTGAGNASFSRTCTTGPNSTGPGTTGNPTGAGTTTANC